MSEELSKKLCQAVIGGEPGDAESAISEVNTDFCLKDALV